MKDLEVFNWKLVFRKLIFRELILLILKLSLVV